MQAAIGYGRRENASSESGTVSALWGDGYGPVGTDSLTVRPIQPIEPGAVAPVGGRTLQLHGD